MTSIHKQILTDPDGKPVHVVIPYQQWKLIEQRLKDLGLDIDTMATPETPRQPRPIGLGKGKFTVPDGFFEPLPDDILDAFSPDPEP